MGWSRSLSAGNHALCTLWYTLDCDSAAWCCVFLEDARHFRHCHTVYDARIADLIGKSAQRRNRVCVSLLILLSAADEKRFAKSHIYAFVAPCIRAHEPSHLK